MNVGEASPSWDDKYPPWSYNDEGNEIFFFYFFLLLSYFSSYIEIFQYGFY